jgi:pimeloyl-ACP methyl ester carboxylesterase
VRKPISAYDLAGLTRFALDGARLITDVVEHAHVAVLGPVGAGFRRPVDANRPHRARGIPGFVYRSIHAGYDIADATLTAAFGALAQEAPAIPTPERAQLLAILNGVWGDYLARSQNPLAIEMSFMRDGGALPVERGALAEAYGDTGGKLLLLAHGLCMDDRCWRDGECDYGCALERDLGYTPLYLRYNTGLHISENGRQLAQLLERLVAAWPAPVEEIAIVGHSMGGLVARSAAHYGTAQGHAWRSRLKRLVFLGAPHHGSRLERAGNYADGLLALTPYSAPFRRLGVTRSAGITDLRHGNIVDEDWQDRDRFGHRDDIRRPTPLPVDVACYAAAVTKGARSGDRLDRLLGDGLVPLDSSLGSHAEEARSLIFPESHRWVGYEMGHLDLLRSQQVYEKLREWLAD